MTYVQFSVSQKVLVVSLFLENFSQNFFHIPQMIQGAWRMAGKTKRKTPSLHSLWASGLMGGGGWFQDVLRGSLQQGGWKGHSSRLPSHTPQETLHLNSPKPQAHSASQPSQPSFAATLGGKQAWGGKEGIWGKCHFQSHRISKKHESAFKPSVLMMLLVSLDPA